MSNTLSNTLIFLINMLFNLYLFILFVRLVLAWINAEYQHPATQFIVKSTSFIIKPLRKYIHNIGPFETATLMLILILTLTKFFIVALLSFGLPNPMGLMLLAAADILKLGIDVFFYTIFFMAILSWIQPDANILGPLNSFTAPILRPIQRVLPIIAGFDLSPVIALFTLQLALSLLVNPLTGIGLALAFS